MSNPTNPFSWQMPTPTDLVTDLPADFEVFGQAVATSLADLLGGTTGQVLSKTTNADMDFTWVTANPGDITGVTAGTGISGGGTSGTVTVTNDMATTITASGDIIVGTGSGTYDNLPIGTTDQVLTADTTVSPYKVKWATPASGGGMTLLSTTTLSGASTTITVTGGYNYITGIVTGVTNNSANGRLYIAPNGTTNVSAATGTARYTGAAASVRVEGYDAGYIDLTRGYDTLRTNADNAWYFSIYNYESSTRNKPFIFGGTYIDNDSTADVVNFQGAFRSSTAITTLVFSQSGGNFSAGTVLLYGVK
jgi:hypothetical protein